MLWADWLVRPCNIPVLFPRDAAFPVDVRSLSPNTPRFTLLNSHVPHRSRQDASWISKSIALLRDMQPSHNLMVTSIGMLQFDLPLYCWLIRGGRAVVLTHPRFFSTTHHHRMMYQWFLNHPCVFEIRIDHIYAYNPVSRKNHAESFRDLLMCALSHSILLGEIIKGGRMEKVCRAWDVEVKQSAIRGHVSVSGFEMERIRVGSAHKSLILQNYLWHFTRALDHPWPENGWEDYCRDLLDPRMEVPYPAIDVLIRILQDRRIRAFRYLVRGQEPMVCFTGTPIHRIPELFTWQNHLKRIRFSPYGIGISRECALDLGFRPVSYSDGQHKRRSCSSSDSYTHARGRGRWDWQKESEFRVRGDVRLDRLSPRECVVIVMKESERVRFGNLTPFPVISWEAMN